MQSTTSVNTTSMRSPTPWLPKFKPRADSRLRLFCFPYAGGTTLTYRNWEANLPASVEVVPVELPGRGSRLSEPFTPDLVEMAKAIAHMLLPHLDKPFAFFGHSMGATLSFELARELRRAHGREPSGLFISGRLAPQLPRRHEITFDLPEPEFVEEIRRLNGTPKEVLEHPELMQIIIPLLRADFEACQTYTYTPEPPLSCPFIVFGGLQDKDISRDELEAWSEHTTGAFSLRMMPGDHFFVNTAQSLILRVLGQELQRQQSQMR
jgi:medium-chain acyl-[acyl-carrier-protein] hydrolase